MGRATDTTLKFPFAGWRPWGTANTFVTTQRNDFKWPVPLVDMCGHLPPAGKKRGRAPCPDFDCRNVCRLEASCVPQYYECPAGGTAFHAPPGMICVELPDSCVALQEPRAGMPSKLECECWNVPCPSPCAPKETQRKSDVPTGFSEYQDRIGRTGACTWGKLHSGALRPTHWDAKCKEPPRQLCLPSKDCQAIIDMKSAKYECAPQNFMSPCPPCQTPSCWRVVPYSVWPERGCCTG